LALLSGESTTAVEYLGGRQSVLLFWNPGFDDRSALIAFEELAARDWAANIRSAIVLSGPFDPAAITVGSGDLPVLVDSGDELHSQIRKFALPLVVVVDQRLGIVATSFDAALAFRIAKALSWSRPGESEAS
jgi:hypothetical protein